jgi:hypothetical protein
MTNKIKYIIIINIIHERYMIERLMFFRRESLIWKESVNRFKVRISSYFGK